MRYDRVPGPGSPVLMGVRSCVLAVLALAGTAGDLLGQRTVMVYEEPRHRVVIDRGDIKLLDVQILPGDTTLDHTHDSPIMYTYINLGNGSTNGRVNANLQYATEAFTHNVSNSGSELFRIIALAHYGDGNEGMDDRPQGIEGAPELENRWFRSYRLELAPGQETSPHRHRNPAIIVQVSDGEIQVTKENGFGAELANQGDWTWRDAGSPYTIRNVGSISVSVVVNEPR